MSKAGLVLRWCSVPALALVMAAGLSGCSSKQEKALEEAKKQAVATGQPQQIVSVDKDGNTTTTVVQPPAGGQKDPKLVTTTTTTAPPASGQPKPKASGPVVSAVPQPPPPQEAAAPPAPIEVSIPAGTSLAVRVDHTISVKSARVGDPFTGEVVDPVMDGNGSLVVPKGTPVAGVVDAAHAR